MNAETSCRNGLPRKLEDSSNVDPAPDDWIDAYVQGKESRDSWNQYSSHGSIKADLEPYSGMSVDWLNWIDIFNSLVHQISMSPGEKLAILKTKLRGDCLDLVTGLGGGERAYKEALNRLKENYGNRGVIRAAHLQALEKLHPGRDNSAQLKRFAEKVRTHLFVLTQMGGGDDLYLIDMICSRLEIGDRLAWNERPPRKPIDGGSEKLNEFGKWLCAGAWAYHNPYDIVAEQEAS